MPKQSPDTLIEHYGPIFKEIQKAFQTRNIGPKDAIKMLVAMTGDIAQKNHDKEITMQEACDIVIYVAQTLKKVDGDESARKRN